MKNNFFVLRENDSSHCIRVFINLLVIFLVITFTASSVSANDENDIWKRYGSKKLYKGDIYTVNDYKIKAFNFPELKKGSIATPFIGLEVYKNDDYVKTITLGLHKSGICDELKITAIDLPSDQVIEWQDDEYEPWGKIEVAIKGKPEFNIKISTDEEEYQQNSIIKVNIIVRNEGNSDAKNVELEYDTGGLDVDSTNIDKSRTRFTRRDSITGKLNLKTPEAIDKKETYTISVTVTGDDLEGGKLSETKSVSIGVLPDSGSIYVYSTPFGAKINIDGADRGTAPLTISDVSVGYHTIKLVKSGYEDYTKNIYVSAGETKTISASLALTPRVVPTARPTPTVSTTGYVSVSSNPINANIEIDGDYRGTTPRTVPVSFGYHTIKLTKSGYEDYIKEIYVSADRTIQMSEKLAPIEPPPSKTALIVFLILIGIAFFTLRSRISKKPASVRTPITNPKPNSPPPTQRYTMSKPIKDGKGGGFGIVHKAEDNWNHTTVAIKLPRDDDDKKVDAIQQLKNEINVLKKLNHKYIISYIDNGFNGELALIEEFFDGKTLVDVMGDCTLLDEKVALGYIVKIAEAINYCHKNSILLRDINPANVLINGNNIRLIDFGLAREVDDITRSHKESYTVAWGGVKVAAPELKHYGKYSNRSDIYSVGALLFIALTNKDNFAVGMDPRKYNPHISEKTVKIVQKCIQREPEKRYESLQSLLDDIR